MIGYQAIALIVPFNQDIEGEPSEWALKELLGTPEQVIVIGTTRVCDTLDAAYLNAENMEIR